MNIIWISVGCLVGVGVVLGLLMWAAAAVGKVSDEARDAIDNDVVAHSNGHSNAGLLLLWAMAALWGLTGCVGDNLADIAQAQAAAEAAKAAQESAQAAQTAVAGLSMAVIAPWVIAILLTVTAVGWVWATRILPAMRGDLTTESRRAQRGGRGGEGRTVVIRPRYEEPQAQLPAPKDEDAPRTATPLTLREMFEMRMMERMMKDDDRRY